MDYNLLSPEKAHNIYLKIVEYYYDKLYGEYEKLNINNPKNFYEFFSERAKNNMLNITFWDFLSYYFKRKWWIK